MDELSHFTGASKLTVNIRGNDIDFKVLWLQMSLVRSFSFCLLRKKKKKKQPPQFDLHFSFLRFHVLRAGKRKTVLHLAPGGHLTSELLVKKSKSDVPPLSPLSQAGHARQERYPQSILSHPHSSSRILCSSPSLEKSSPKAPHALPPALTSSLSSLPMFVSG